MMKALHKEPVKPDEKGVEKMEQKIKVVTPTMKANDALFYKMQIEFEETMDAITKFPSEEMVEMATEVAMKEIILKCMEVRDISYKAAQGLNKLDFPLEYVFANFIQSHTLYEGFYDFVEDCGTNLYASFKHES